MPRPHIPAIIFCSILCGCGSCAGLPDRNIKRIVTAQEVVGTWKLTPATLGLLQRNKYHAAPEHANTIVFNADGSMKFASVISDASRFQYAEASGKWILEHDKRNELTLVAEKIHETFGFADEGGKLILWQYFGDPDSWEFIEYERIR